MIDPNITMTDWSGKTDHDLSGWFFDVLIDQPFQYNVCAVPTTGLPAYPNYNAVTIEDSLGNIIAILNGGQTYVVANTMTNTYDLNTSFTGTNFTLTQTPSFIYGVYLNGQCLTINVDYTVPGNDIIFTNATAGDTVLVVYNY